MQGPVQRDQESVANGAHAVAEAFKLSIFIAVAGLVGLAPAALCFNSPKLFFFLVAEGAVVAFFSVFNKAKRVDYSLGLMECLFVWLSSVAFWGFLGIAWLLSYKVVYWLLRLVGLLFSSVSTKADPIGFVVAAVIAIIFTLGIALAIAENIQRRYLSGAESSRTAFYYRALRGQNKTWLYAFASMFGLAVMGAILWKVHTQAGFWLYFGLQWVPYIASFWLLNLGVRARNDSGVFFAVVRLLDVAGYQTIVSPHSDNAIVNGVLSGVDLVAFNQKHTYIIKVKTRTGSTEPVEWTVGSSLKQKVRALQFGTPSIRDLEYLKDRTVHPLLVLCGREEAQTLIAFSHEEDVPIVKLPMEVIDRIFEADLEEVTKLADQYFSSLAKDTKEVTTELAQPRGDQWAY